MKTLHRELESLIVDYIYEWNKSHNDIYDLEKFAKELSNLILSLRAFKATDEESPPYDTNRADLAWNILSGQDITQDKLDGVKLTEEAVNAFEIAFDKVKFPWNSTKVWTDFYDFVVQTYHKDKASRRQEGNVWSDYTLWRSTDGKYGKAMTNIAIRKDPLAFMDVAFPTFEASSWSNPMPLKKVEGQPEELGDGEIYIG